MNFPFESKKLRLLNRCSVVLFSFSVTAWTPLVHAETLLEAMDQVMVWKEELAQATRGGNPTEVEDAKANLRAWEQKAAEAKAREPQMTPEQQAALRERQEKLAEQQAAILREKQEQLEAEQARRDQEERIKNGLATAVQEGDYNEAKRYVDQGGKPTLELVQAAIDGGFTGIAYLLIKNGAPNDPTVLGKALIKAIHLQDRDRASDLLVKLEANPNYSENGITPLSVAARQGDIGLIGLLLQAGAQRDSDALGMVMFQAVQNGEREQVKSLLDMGANPNYANGGTTALAAAVNKGDYGMAGILINEGASPDPQVLGQALLSSVDRGDGEDVVQLLKLGASVNYSNGGAMPLTVAIENQDIEMANMLLRYEATDSSGRYGKKTFDAAMTGDTAWLSVLSKIESYANYRNSDGETPIHAAASTGATLAVTTLLQSGVNPNIQTIKNWTPLHHAARFGHKLALINLLKAGADVYAVNSDGFDAIKLAHIALNDPKNDIDSRGCIEYLNLWMQHHPRDQ